MQPKKKSMIAPIAYGACLIFVLYFALHGAIAYDGIIKMVEAGEIDKNQQLFTFFEVFINRLAFYSDQIYFNAYTKNWILYSSLAWFIIVMMIEDSKKNYIHGKEFGTARWGTIANIRDLFASSIEAKEIKRAKGMNTKLGRWKAKYNAYKECENNGQQIQKVKLQQLKDSEEINKLKGKFNKKEYQEKQAEIKKQIAEDVANAKRQAWKPDQFKAEYEHRLEEIDKEVDESNFFSDEEKEKQKAKRKEEAKKDFETKINKFFNTAELITEIKKKYKDADQLFTKTERISIYNFVLNNNTLIMGGSGSGKTRGYVMPNILQAHSSYIITDPKGEILEKAGYFLTEIKGYKIRVLNLDNKAESDGYNPFVYIHPERAGYEERVLSLIETIIVNTDGGEAAKANSSDPFWPKAERLFLQAIFFFVTDGFVPEERNMNTVFKLIQMLNIGEEEDNMDSDLDYFARIFEERFGEDHIGVETFKEFRGKAAGKTAKSIVISAVARLAPFRTSEVRRIFSYDNMNLDMVGEEKTAIFVVVPPTDKTFNFIAGMLFTQLFQELQYCATQVHKHQGQRLPVPVRFIMDEFANTCTVPQFVEILAYARSFGIGITPILQSLDQLKKMYEKDWGVIIDNCNTLLYLGSITNAETLKYMSELLGKGTYDKRTTGRSKGKSDGSSQNEDVVGRELMFPDEIRKMPKKDCLFIVGGRPPFYSEKYEYKDHPNYRFTSDANKAYSYHYIPQPPPDVQKAMEEAELLEEQLQPSENAKVNIVPIEVDTDHRNQISRITKNIDSLELISDEGLMVNDGEDTAEEIVEKSLAELLGEEEAAKEEAKLTVSEETKIFLENLHEQRIEVETNMLKTLNRMGRSFRNLEIISDEEMTVKDGESTEDTDEKAVEYIMDSDDSLSEEEMKDMIESDVENINEFLASLGDFENIENLDNLELEL